MREGLSPDSCRPLPRPLPRREGRDGVRGSFRNGFKILCVSCLFPTRCERAPNVLEARPQHVASTLATHCGQTGHIWHEKSPPVAQLAAGGREVFVCFTGDLAQHAFQRDELPFGRLYGDYVEAFRRAGHADVHRRVGGRLLVQQASADARHPYHGALRHVFHAEGIGQADEAARVVGLFVPMPVMSVTWNCVLARYSDGICT